MIHAAHEHEHRGYAVSRYLPEVLVYMDHGGSSASTGSLGSYMDSFREAKAALADNEVPHPMLITLKRTVKVCLQFMKRK